MQIIPTTNPKTLEQCLEVLSKIKYKSYGFPMFFLDFHQLKVKDYGEYWSCCYRNPVNFDNPRIEEKTPLDACHKMLDFLREIEIKNGSLGERS
jgi:hypothetical protein